MKGMRFKTALCNTEIMGAFAAHPLRRFAFRGAAKRYFAGDSRDALGTVRRYVGRGGLKLEKALQHFGIAVQNMPALDIGASTGGFTDCLLQHGAAEVWAVDVGRDQLAESLRRSPAVHVFEQTDIRAFAPDRRFPLIVSDLSFISLRQILPDVKRLLTEDGDAVLLFKPQFEAGRENVGKKGIVKHKSLHVKLLLSFFDFLRQTGFVLCHFTYSPIRGQSGNIEYLLHIRRSGLWCTAKADEVVEEAFTYAAHL